jgi:glycosyltransferase involved in cell wall biosynthesis
MNALIISPLFPLPVVSGGSTRLYNLIRHTGRRHSIHMLSLARAEQHGCTGELPGLAAPATLIPGKVNTTIKEQLTDALAPAQWPRTIRRFIDRARGMPRAASRVYFPALERAITQALTARHYDVVQLEFTEMARYVPLIRQCAPRARIVLEEIDIAYVALQRLIGSAPHAQQARLADECARLTDFERRAWSQCDAIVTMSEVDRAHVLSFGLDPASVWSVANGVDPEYFAFHPPAENAQRVLFLGFFKHTPNVTGLLHFVNNVWPIVRARVPQACLDVVGAQAPPEIARLDGQNGIALHGYVPDVRDIMCQCSIMAAPILHGSGTRLKILEAFAAGLPVVSTGVGCEGIDVRHGQHALIADASPDMADAVVALLNDPEKARRLALNARQLVEQAYAWPAIANRLEEVWRHATK